jgi:histone H3/H4
MTKNADTAVIEKARYLARQRLEVEPLTLSAGIKLERADRESLSKSYYEWAHRKDDDPRIGFSVWLRDAIMFARGGKMPEADEALRRLAAEFLKRGETMPNALQDYIVEVLCAPLPPSKFTTLRGGRTSRDLSIAATVEEIAREFGLKPTRNASRAQVSACSIVAEVLADLKINLSEDAVEHAWKEYRRYIKKRLSSENF